MSAGRDEVVRLDRAHVWHPYTAIDVWERTSPLVVARAEGSALYDAGGKRYLDGNASWWVAALGHAHPRLLRVLREQAATLDHCAFAGITHEPSARLAAELAAVAPGAGLNRVFYTDNGSGSIEVAIKIALQRWKLGGAAAAKKTRFVALDGAYHGDTLGPTSLGGVEVFRRPYQDVLFDVVHAPFPAPDAYARAFAAMSELIERDHDTIAGVVVEPVVQGAAGMRVYDPRYLTELRALTQEHDVLLIVDEVFTGYGRTGAMWACEHAGVTPDILCIGKVFASVVPMAATLVTDAVYDAFRGGGRERALYYGHTFCGNPIGAALAREVLAIYRDEDVVARTRPKAAKIAAAFERIAALPGVERVRTQGMIGAADLAGSGSGGYLGEAGWRVYERALERGAYLRPLGDTVYVCPPLVIDDADLDDLLRVLAESITG
ncbi:MAG: adenosylmethionine--8-amino-7-oxononanoate transaminase [Labilithrix sp.]|nr:adenosylmethionine--8-amino-7-oxononanoate transaminase [Labilithrix sp.]MCW5814571.1 adenosylmethionine--8-amino-7-oxononanoate transaminase [Labilithrix sp.]